MTFPVSQSVLDADALADELRGRYDLQGDVRCRLLSRGMNDIYRIEHRDGPHALKVARARRGTDDEFAYEQAYILYLASKGIVVPTPVTTADGSYFFAVQAPEGNRRTVLMAWLEGEPYQGIVDVNEARRMGQLLAHLHLAAADFETPHQKAVATAPKIKQRLPFLLELLKDQPEDAEFLQKASAAAIEQFETLDSNAIPWGPCHGDLQNANVMKSPDGSLAVFDFSDCGTDRLAKDIAAFYWRNDFEGLSQEINQTFVDGYNEVRPLSLQEREAQPLFRVLRHLLITSSFAQYVNQIGPVRGFDRKVGFYTDMIRTCCEEANLP